MLYSIKVSSFKFKFQFFHHACRNNLDWESLGRSQFDSWSYLQRFYTTGAARMHGGTVFLAA